MAKNIITNGLEELKKDHQVYAITVMNDEPILMVRGLTEDEFANEITRTHIDDGTLGLSSYNRILKGMDEHAGVCCVGSGYQTYYTYSKEEAEGTAHDLYAELWRN